MRILPLLIASAAILYSCDKKESSDVASSTNDSVNIAETATANSTLSEENAQLPTQDATAVAVNNPSDKPALNPEHGQPYHRCEIPVGAPIDSAPAQNAAPQVMPQQNLSSNNFNTNPISPSLSAPAAAPVSAPQATGPKPANNPAHGEPHHRCDIEVGAPLT